MISTEEKLLKERILNLLSSKKQSISSIAETESDRVMLGRQIKGENTIVPFRTLYRLLYMFPEISADWLIMGEGSMQKSEHLAPHIFNQHNEVKGNTAGGDINVGPDTIVTRKTVDELTAQLSTAANRIAELERDKHNMQLLIDALTVKSRK